MTSIDGEMSPGEISRTLKRIDQTVSELAHELRNEMRETRHKAANALTGVELQKERNIFFEEKIDRLDRSDERQWTDLNHLRENAASQDAVDAYRKWLFGGGAVLGLIAAMNLIVNIVQNS